MESILFNSSKVWLAENSANGNMQATFVLCDFGTNLNGVRLNRDTIENWMGSLVNQPLVGKIVKGAFGQSPDFAGHQMRKEYVKDEFGNMVQQYTFDTNAYGVFVSVGIETVDGVECVVGTAEIWDRYPKTVQLIKDRITVGTLHTSWEISVSEYAVDADGVKVINSGVFTALALLGERVQPAYESSRLLEVAEADVDDELVSAIEEDMKEYDMAKNKKVETATEEVVVEQEPVASETEETVEQTEVTETEDVSAEESAESTDAPEHEENAEEQSADEPEDNADMETSDVEASALTVHDLRRRIERAVEEKLHKRWVYISYLFPEEHMVWVEDEERESELDYILFVYSVEGDEVVVDDGTPVQLTVSIASVNETLAQKDAAIAAALAENEELKAQVAELSEIKTKYDAIREANAKAEAEAKKDELRSYAMKSGLFTDGELAKGNVKKLIEALDQVGINQMIADRYMAKLARASAEPSTEIETSEVHQKSDAVNLTAEDVKPVRQNVVRMFIEN